MNVLFVCSGNICRSPMAAACFRHRARADGLEQATVSSAGTLGIEGAPASAEAIETMGELGIDLSGHRSSALDAIDVEAQDVVILMTRNHVEELAHRFPQLRGEHYMLRAFESGPDPEPNPPDLDDPMGRPAEVYRAQLQQITRCIDNLVTYVRQLPRGERS